MPGILQFALALKGGNFLSTATGAAGALGSLIGVTVGVGAAIGKLAEQIGRGARMEDLANRTGIAAGALNTFQRGAQAAGVDGDRFLGIITGLQRSLGGFNEMGEPTKDVFAGLGLAVDDLKKKDPAAAFEDIAAKLSGLNNSDATNLAGKIFGKGVGGDALQIARNFDEFAGAAKRASRESEVLNRHAGSFNSLGNSAGEFRRQLDSAALGIAAGLTPSLKAITEMLNGIDVEGLGHKLGNVFLGLGEAIRQQKLEEVIELAISAGVQGGVNVLKEKIKEIPGVIAGAVKEGLTSDGKGSRRTRAFLANSDPTGILRSVVGAQELARLVVKPAIEGAAGSRNVYAQRLQALQAKLQADAEERIKVENVKRPVIPSKVEDPKQTAADKAKEINSAGPVGRGDVDPLSRIGFFSVGNPGGQALQSIRETSRQTVEQLRNLNAFIARKPHLFNDGAFVNHQ